MNYSREDPAAKAGSKPEKARAWPLRGGPGGFAPRAPKSRRLWRRDFGGGGERGGGAAPSPLPLPRAPVFLIAHLLHPIATLFSLPPHLLQRFRSSTIHSASPLPVSFASPSFPVLWAPSLHLFHPNIFLALPARQLLHLSRFPLFPGALGSAFPWLPSRGRILALAQLCAVMGHKKIARGFRRGLFLSLIR